MPEVLEEILLGYIDPTDYMRCLKVLAGPIDQVIPADYPAEVDRGSPHQQTRWNKMRAMLSRLILKNEWPDYDADDSIIQVKIDLLLASKTREVGRCWA